MSFFSDDLVKFSPLAERMRPSTLDEFLGQEHLLFKDSFFYRAIKSNSLGSSIFYGPPGTGKTTLAHIISKTCKGEFEKLNAVSSGVSEAKKIIESAKNNLELFGKKTFLLLDECHRWSKAQSDCILEGVEKGYIIFIGSTTENPYIAMTKAIVSRCTIFEFKPLSVANIKHALDKAILDKKNGFGGISLKVDSDAILYFAQNCSGDLRNAYNSLELAVKTSGTNKEGQIVVSKQDAVNSMQKGGLSLDENSSYDLLSAFCKSIRGSDAEAALYYAQRLLQSGYDPRIIARRLVAHASEDIGMADSNALLIANIALNSCEKVGMPECNLNLCHAIIYLCEAEKSNSVYFAMHKAMDDAEKFKHLTVPNMLKNHPAGFDDKTGKYKYPHNFGGYVDQQYLPNEIKNAKYYVPSNNGKEKNLVRKKKIK